MHCFGSPKSFEFISSSTYRPESSLGLNKVVRFLMSVLVNLWNPRNLDMSVDKN